MASRLLIINTHAGSIAARDRETLRREFSDHLQIEFDPSDDFRRLITEDAVVVVAGGDGTVGYVARRLIDTPRALGIIGLGTFNNFARSLGIPSDLEGAARVIKEGRPKPVTVGRVNGKPFLEAAAIGIFGEAIELGQAAKDLRFGELGYQLSRLLSAVPFHYRLSGDVNEEGTASSLVFANTPSTGAQLAIAEGSPADPFLELSRHAGESALDIVGRLAASALLHRHHEHGTTTRFRRLQVETMPSETVRETESVVRVIGDDAELGITPVTVEADLNGLQVILP